MSRHVFTNEEVEFLIKNYPTKGRSWCANELNLSISQIISKTSRLGLKVNYDVKSNIYKKSKKNFETNRKPESFNVNPVDFMNLNSPYHIYILGLIWSDGHVTFANNKSKTPLIKHTSISIDSEDFLPIFNLTGKWCSFKYENKKLGYKPVTIINTSNRVLGEWLILNGYRNKIKAPLFLDKIETGLRHYFFRGLSDGDGCFENNIKQIKYKKKGLRFTLSSSCDQDWSFVIKTMNELNLSYNIRKQINKKGCSSQLMLNYKESLAWAEYIYGGLDFGLARKKQKWVDVVLSNQ